jgi:NADPH:quinone reductase-like Zn-dependent oxidoreductase
VTDWLIAHVVPFERHGGTYAEKIVVPEGSAVPAPRSACLPEASTLLLNATTARPAPDALGLPPESTIAVFAGPGAPGSYVIHLATADSSKHANPASPAERRRRRHPEGRPD